MIKQTIIYFFFIGTILNGQTTGMFGKVGESLIGIEGQYDSESDAGSTISTINIGGSYVLDGNIEVAMDYGMSKVKYDNDSSMDLDFNGLSFGGYYHIKSNESIPVNIRVGGAYSEAKASADWLDDANVDLESKATSFGGGLYKSVYEKDATIVMAHINLSSVASEATLSDMNGNSDKTKDDYFYTSVGIALRSNNVFISPSIARVDGESSFQISFGLLLPQ
jgi:hypothetical protein